MHFNIYELLGLHNIHMSCSYQSPEYECDTNSHKKTCGYKCSRVASTTREHPCTWDTQLLSVAHGNFLRVTMRGHGVGHAATKRGTRQLFACNHAWTWRGTRSY